MPREARRRSISGIYHIMLRGADGRNIFGDDRDRERFYTPLWGRWRGEDQTVAYWATPLVGTKSGYETGWWFLPFGNNQTTERASGPPSGTNGLYGRSALSKSAFASFTWPGL